MSGDTSFLETLQNITGDRALTRDTTNPKCCQMIQEIGRSIKSGKLYFTKEGLRKENVHGFVASRDIQLLATKDIMRHMKKCLGYSEFLEELLLESSKSKKCDPKDHHYFLTCLAVALDGCDTASYEKMWSTIPFLRFSMRARWYDPHRYSWPFTLGSGNIVDTDHLDITGDSIHFSDRKMPSAQEVLQLPHWLTVFPGYNPLLSENKVFIEMYVGDLNEIIEDEEEMPAHVVNMCQAVTPVSEYESMAYLITYRNYPDMCKEDDNNIEVLLQVDITNYCQGSVYGELDETREYDASLFLRAHTFNWHGEYVIRDMRTLEELNNDSIERGLNYKACAQDIFGTSGKVTLSGIVHMLNVFTSRNKPIFWRGNEIIMRKDSRAKSARK